MAPRWFQPCLALLGLLPAALGNPISSRALPLTPATDPFYQPPAGYASTAPGTILRSRVVDVGLIGLIPIAEAKSYQLLFRTQSINGTAIAGVTTLFVPINATLNTESFISFQTAYDGAATICDPSYNDQLGSSQQDLISDFELLVVQGFLASGYIVSSPDYEGPEAAFAAGRLEGTGVLDSMRAVTNFHETLGLKTSAPSIVGVGYSGGAIATGWAASLQQSYAPELPIKGWAAGGTPANLTGTALYLDNTAFSGFLPDAVAGLIKPSAYAAEAKDVIKTIVTPYGQSLIDYADSHCISDLFNFFEKSLLSTTVQSLGDRLYYQPNIAAVMAQNVMGISANITPIAPILLYHATLDEIIPYDDVEVLVDRWCDNGASVDFTTYAAGGHLTTEIVGFPQVFTYVQSAFAGNISKGCTRQTKFGEKLNPLALGLDLEPLLLGLVNALTHLGPHDTELINDLNVLNYTVSAVL